MVAPIKVAIDWKIEVFINEPPRWSGFSSLYIDVHFLAKPYFYLDTLR